MIEDLRNHKLVEDVELDDVGYFIWLAYGWQLSHEEQQHCFGADNAKEALQVLSEAVTCTCSSCEAGLMQQL